MRKKEKESTRAQVQGNKLKNNMQEGKDFDCKNSSVSEIEPSHLLSPAIA